MNIYKYELRMYVKSIIAWSLSIFALLVMFMTFYPTFGNDASLLDKMLENYPKELLAAFGMGGELSLSTVLGYFAFTFVFVQLCLAIQASNYGFSFLSVEEREFTADFLLSKPVSRKNIIAAKFLAAMTALTITNIIVWIASFTAIEMFREGKAYGANKLLLLLASIAIFQMFFLSIGMIVSVTTKKVRSVLSYSMALSFGLYIMNAVRGVVGGDLLGYVSPFYHFDPVYILDKGEYNLPMAAISVAVIIVSIGTSYFLYLKRNIHSL